MNSKLNRLMKEERGITALETAIILIAFVVVAAIFAFTVLSTGTFLTERSKEAAYAGLQEVRGSLELKGSVIAYGTAPTAVENIEFYLSTVAGGQSVDTSKIKMSFRNKTVNTDLTKDTTDPTVTPDNWSVNTQFISPGTLGRFTINVAALAANDTFAIEVKPPTGGVMLIERTVPARLDTVTDLH